MYAHSMPISVSIIFVTRFHAEGESWAQGEPHLNIDIESDDDMPFSYKRNSPTMSSSPM